MRTQLLWLAGIVVLVIGLVQLLWIGSWEEFLARFGGSPRASSKERPSPESSDTGRDEEDPL